jgi:hypothetical protein
MYSPLIHSAPTFPPIIQVTGDPDGVVVQPKGMLAIDPATGITWKNQDGGSRWEPSDIPDGAGFIFWEDGYATVALAFTNTAGGGNVNASADTVNQGVRRLTVTAVGDGVSVTTTNNNTAGLLLGGGKVWARTLFRVATRSDGTNNIVFRIGPGDGTAILDNTDAVYLEYDFATYGDHNFRLCAANNGTRTKLDTGIALVASAGVMTSALLMVNAAGTSLTARIGGVAATSAVTTNIPTAVNRVMAIANAFVQKQLGAGALTFDFDGFGFKHVLTNPRTF